MSSILITGVTGFTGSYLAKHIARTMKNANIVGVSRYAPSKECDYEFIKCDLLDSTRIKEIVKNVKPEYVFHLAGLTTSNDPKALYEVNVLGTINLLDGLKIIKEEIDPKTLVVGSSAEYGVAKKDEMPISETNPLRPITYYGISKVSEDLLGFQYYHSYDLKIIRARPFNLVGPGQSSDFVCGAFVKQIVEIEQKSVKPEIFVGNLGAKRDFIDVRDVVKAYVRLMSLEKYGDVYNIGSGKCYSIKEVLNTLLNMVDVEVQIKQKPNVIKGHEVPIQVSDVSKIKRDVGWEPEISFEKSLEDMLNYERKILERQMANR